MPHRKIATCCYCGARAALVLTGTARHELACAGCGAPLHDLKMLKADHVEDRRTVKPSPLHDWQGAPDGRPARPRPGPRKAKRRKGFGRRLFEEAFDLIEDIFD
ncbi:hypothetical protein ACRDNQ_14480 [Palleronia sp. KMU-117]|uniref:hypothetical protein n=1 Tax=Palleronia sp. KMU-117 TaxID=3434108 RepID=UPI003D72F426